MSVLEYLKPQFWHHPEVGAGKRLFNFRRIWVMTVILTTVVVLAPLLFMGLVDYRLSKKAIESEILFRTARLVSNTGRTITYFLAERRAALSFVVHENSFEELIDHARLASILENLKKAFGGFVDLGVIDPLGNQRSYVGPYDLEGKDYGGQEWYREVLSRGVYLSEVFLGYRAIPHLVISVKRKLPNGLFYVVRATLDTEKFNELLSGLEMAGKGDAFLINRQGILQTPSLYHGGVLERLSVPVPEYSPRTRVYQTTSPKGALLIVGYRYIPNSPFILMVIKQKKDLMRPWQKTLIQLTWFLGASIFAILVLILGGTTYLVNRIYLADQRRLMALHEVEYASKMASIGRLAAGVAHEINNPLAIINEKAGLLKDLLELEKGQFKAEKLMGLVDSILEAVDRCGRITKRLLSFARHMEVSIENVNLGQLIHEVLGFLMKEAEYRSIHVSVEVPPHLPEIKSDRGKLQEIFLNLFNNAFTAMSDGGHLDVKVSPLRDGFISVTVADDGCGIPEQDLKHIFEPFFSTRTKRGGTGLGLSITYGLVQEIGGKISVDSEVGKGTTFTVILPSRMKEKRKENHASTPG
ncbi:MAG: two-component sensor histidine kinase [Deltaproteobacteria bacterium]|nr:two-component sensor histidine kinase [Deltaproteobacteria bacterium]